MTVVLPSQRNSISKKKQVDFYKPTYDYFIDLALSLKDTDIVAKCINASNGIIDMDTFNYIMKPMGNDIKEIGDLPGELRNTDFITPVKEKNLGEYIELPYKFFVKVDNVDAVLRRDDQLKKEVTALMQKQFAALLAQSQGEDGQPTGPPPDIEQFSKDFLANWSDTRAEEGQHTLNLINDLTSFDIRRIQDFYSWWSTEEFYTYRYIDGEAVVVESISPLDGFPIPNGSQFNEDNDGFVIKRRISWNQFVDKYGNEISSADRSYVEELQRSYSSTGVLSAEVKFLRSRFGEEFDKSIGNDFGSDSSTFSFDGTNNNDIDEYIIIFKSEVPVKILNYENSIGEVITTEVDSSYEFDSMNGDIDIATEWRQEVFIGRRFGTHDRGIYMPPVRCDVQRYDKNTRTCKLPVGGKQGILQGIPRNPIPLRMVPYLAWDRFINLQIERTIAKFKGDIWTIPKGAMNPDEAGTTEQKYFYMMADNTLMYDETLISVQDMAQGFRVVGNPGLERYIKVLIDLRQGNKAEAYDLANMNEERAGAAANSQTVGNAQQNIYRAKLGSTLMITMFNAALERDHIADLEFSKYAWINGKKGTYFDKSTNTPINVDIDPVEHLTSEYGVFVRNSKVEEAKFNSFKDLAFSAAQNGDSELASEAIMAESTPELHKFIKKFTAEKRDFEQSQNEAKNKAIMDAAQMAKDTADQLIQKDLDIANVRADSAAEVAYIQVSGFNDESKTDNSFSDADLIANAKNAREERRIALAERSQIAKENTDKAKLAISKQKPKK
jgi:hypothetical protein